MQFDAGQMNVIIYALSDVVLVLRREIYAEMHQHHAIQMTIAMEGNFQVSVDQRVESHQAFVIASDYPHLVQGQAAWVATFLINPETALARAMQKHILQQASYASLDEEKIPFIIESLRKGLSQTSTCAQIDALVHRVCSTLLSENSYGHTLDVRIAEALEIIEQSGERKISAKALSEEIFLSEGRLGHLFKREIGIPLRRYMLWRRLLAALNNIFAGESFTFSAHEAGFTDSAHLSHTFRQMFGISLSTMFADRKLIIVVNC